MEIRRISSLGTTDHITGNNVRVKVLKNKLAPPFKTICTEIHFGKGVSLTSEIVQLAEENELLIRKGAWYKYQDKNVAQGKGNMKILLEKDKELRETLYSKLKEILSH